MNLIADECKKINELQDKIRDSSNKADVKNANVARETAQSKLEEKRAISLNKE